MRICEYRPRTVEAWLSIAVFTFGMLLTPHFTGAEFTEFDLTGYVLVALITLPGMLVRRAPVAVCVLVNAAYLLYVLAGYWPLLIVLGPVLAVYTVAYLRTTWVSVTCAAMMSSVWIVGPLISYDTPTFGVVTNGLFFPAVIWRFGAVARRTGELTRKLRREQAERARREVAQERGRIARELHDVVAHHMSVVSVQAGLARFVFSSDPDTARTALGTIEEVSAEALEEMRRMLHLLRSEDGGYDCGAPVAPMPGVERLDEMVERVRSGGVPVDLHVVGAPRPLAPGVELCVYRVVQEALTNVLKHTREARATVELHYRPTHLTVSVIDDGKGVIPARLGKDGGHGLIGMRERAKLYGGSISIGPRSEGGFAVRLTLPTSAQGAAQGDNAES
ncbi:sensor histidine kinase [Streptomyces sp. P1-3]|uniref:sensor histidine kinase n=1 Tax=Streptomyces sp. P1-3 TaxID=3421658 RepID=UPI003D369309